MPLFFLTVHFQKCFFQFTEIFLAALLRVHIWELKNVFFFTFWKEITLKKFIALFFFPVLGQEIFIIWEKKFIKIIIISFFRVTPWVWTLYRAFRIQNLNHSVRKRLVEVEFKMKGLYRFYFKWGIDKICCSES